MGAFCDDCGVPVDAGGGTFQFFYANKRSGSPKWSEPRTVCAKHKQIRVAAGHTARTPDESTAPPADDESE